MNRICCVGLAVICWVSTHGSSALADVLFESGTLGPTGLTFADFGGGAAPTSSGVTPNVFSGVRFQIASPANTTRVGGHFVVRPSSNDSFFGAIVRLDNATDFPDSGDLSTPDVLGETPLGFPSKSTEVFGELAVPLSPGWYGLVFGSGLFGATGSGAAVLNNPDIGSPSYIAHQTAAGWIELSTLPGPFQNFRLVVEGVVVPEPASFTTALFGAVCLARKGVRTLFLVRRIG